MLWIRNDIFRIDIRILIRILHEFFSNNLNINFTFVFPSCNCVRLHIMTRYKLFGKFFDRREFTCLNWVFCWEIVKFYQSSVTSNSFRSRRCPDLEWFFRIRILQKFRIQPDPDLYSDLDRQKSSTGNYLGLGSKAWRTAGGTMDVPLYICLFSEAKSTSGACVWTKTFAENFWHHQVGRWACMEQTSVKHFQRCINILNASFSLTSCYLS